MKINKRFEDNIKENDFIEYLKKSKIPIIIIIVFLLFTYGERLINTGYSIDTEYFMYDFHATYNWMNDLNRWGYTLLNVIFKIGEPVIFQSNYLMIINLILSSILINYYIYILLGKDYKKPYLKYQFIIPCILYSSPIFAEQLNFTMQNFAVSFALVLLPSTLILFEYLDKYKEKKKSILWFIYNALVIGITSIIFGVYQSLILLYIMLVCIGYLLKCISVEKNCFDYLIKNILRFIVTTIIYFTISKIVSSGNSYLKLGFDGGINSYINNIINYAIGVIKGETIYYNIGYLISIILLLYIIVKLIKDKKLNIGSVFAIIGIVLAPYYIVIVTGVDQLKRTQLNYPMFIAIIIMISVLLLYNSKKTKNISKFLVIIAAFISYYQANNSSRLFASDRARYESDYELAQKIENTIEEQEWYRSDKEYILTFVGGKGCKRKECNLIGEVAGKSFFEFDYPYYYGPSSRAVVFMSNMGYKYREPSPQKFKAAKKYVQENDFEVFPNKESIQLVDDKIIIIRLSKEID